MNEKQLEQEARELCLLRQQDPDERVWLGNAPGLQIVVTPNDTMKLLTAEDLQEVLKSEHAEDYFIGGMVDRDNNTLVLYRGAPDRLLVPLDFFMKKDQAVKPDFADFDITDVGQTLRFGDYEAASSAVLYEFDAAARKRMRALEGLQTIDYLGPVCSPDEDVKKGSDRLSEVVENELDIKDPKTEWYGDITLSSLTSHNLELMSSIARDLDELEERRALDADVFWVADTIGTATNSMDAHSAAQRLLDAQWLTVALKRHSMKNRL